MFLQGRRKFYVEYLALYTFMNLIKRTVKNQDKKLVSRSINFQKKKVKKDEKEKKMKRVDILLIKKATLRTKQKNKIKKSSLIILLP